MFSLAMHHSYYKVHMKGLENCEFYWYQSDQFNVDVDAIFEHFYGGWRRGKIPAPAEEYSGC